MMTRSPLGAYLLLARVSNLPTAWSNVLAGLALAGAGLDSWPWLALAVSGFYSGGMFLNDAFDAAHDAAHRPDRPIPAGDVRRGEVVAIGALLIAGGEGLLVATPRPAAALAWGAALAVAIVVYNRWHKGVALAPLVMGLCRGLVYLVAAAAVAPLSSTIVMAAAGLMAYVVALTVVARQAGPRAATLMPWLIAGISLVDAAVIVAAGQPRLAVWAMAAFAATRLLQRVVPGT
ncbi:MAG: UbiA family prenyltransferase [Acidobacteriota bacterium]